jgi:hypothetical protein
MHKAGRGEIRKLQSEGEQYELTPFDRRKVLWGNELVRTQLMCYAKTLKVIVNRLIKLAKFNRAWDSIREGRVRARTRLNQ